MCDVATFENIMGVICFFGAIGITLVLSSFHNPEGIAGPPEEGASDGR